MRVILWTRRRAQWVVDQSVYFVPVSLAGPRDQETASVWREGEEAAGSSKCWQAGAKERISVNVDYVGGRAGGEAGGAVVVV